MLVVIFLAHLHATEKCEIRSFKTVITTREFNLNDAKRAVKTTNCKNSVNRSFEEILLSGRGVFNSYWFKKTHSAKIVPAEINIISIEDFIAEKTVNRDSWHFKNARFLHSNAVYLEEGETFGVMPCLNCAVPGRKRIAVEISGPRTKKTVWVEGDLVVKTRALVLRQDANIGEALKLSQVEHREVYSTRPEDVFTEKNDILFYKLGTTKRRGDIINRGDLLPAQLILPGRPVDIVSLYNGIKISSKALAQQSGVLGDIVRLKNMKTKKVIVGRVVDFNKVSVDL